MSAAETSGSLAIAGLEGAGATRAAATAEVPAAPVTTAAERLHGRRVVVVGLDYSPAAAPIAPYTTALAEHLASLGCAVTVLAGLPERADGRAPSSYRAGFRFAGPGWLTPDAPQVVRLRHTSSHGSRPLSRALRELTFFLAVVRDGRALAADVVVGVTPSAGGAAAAARLAARRGVPLVTVVQGTTGLPDRPPRRPAGPGGRLTARLLARMERSALRRSDQVAVTSAAFQPAAAAAGVDPERLHLMPNWTRVRPAAESRLAARDALGWSLDRFTVVHAGPMGHRQDLTTLVEAARVLAVRADDVHAGAGDDGLATGTGTGNGMGSGIGTGIDVVLVGEGSQRAALQQQAFGLADVRFLDADDDVAPLVLAAADVLVTAGGEQGQLASYLGAGRPVIAVVPENSAVACELRRSGGAGIRVGPGDPLALADAVLALHASPQRRAGMARAALRYARAHLGREAAMHRLELVLDAALADAAGCGRGC